MITTLTSEEWDEEFIPIMDGESYKDFHPKVVNDDEKKVLEKALLEDRVWTLLEGDNGDLFLANGLHFVNRLDVYITEKPYDRNSIYEINWEY
tara:strand:- start:91 stop:369 length:279 start_codon:yes stop_codon:yes gene_type:complete